jgi:hypothetical protein
MARAQFAGGNDYPRLCRVVANVLNKEPQTADKWWYSMWEVGLDVTAPHLKKTACEILRRAPDLDGFFGMTEATENGHQIWRIEFKESLWGTFV